ncbi:hypothetical protein EI427_21635 [Flammeovirga pectinis]|uniref:Uncharacterized protein n=1 Tax=Flammeovirga pectinis TaxID=2494373 RepID=A0A3Q9FPY1_9BACT|nr:hypothetical protein [Flammeovirga pectinis]AZQ64830.1 hypothetical protein EI427_21635 [Flammeovirga pectinis]
MKIGALPHTLGLSYHYKRWELEALFGLNISFNTDSLNLDIAERWLAESKLKYRLGEERKEMLTLGHGWQLNILVLIIRL